MKRTMRLPLLIFTLITAMFAFYLSQTSTSTRIYNFMAYPPPESYQVSSTQVPYPGPEDVTTTPVLTEKVITIKISIDVLVDGLEGNDTVELKVVPDTEKTTSRLQALGVLLPILSLHNESQRIAIGNIPVGTYKLMVSAPTSYFREPRGYLFQVSEAGIVNNSGLSFQFTLIPPSAQDLPPCKDTMVKEIPLSLKSPGDLPFEDQKIICRAERLIDISAPPKQPARP